MAHSSFHWQSELQGAKKKPAEKARPRWRQAQQLPEKGHLKTGRCGISTSCMFLYLLQIGRSVKQASCKRSVEPPKNVQREWKSQKRGDLWMESDRSIQ